MPPASVWIYLREREVILQDSDYYAAKMTLPQPPQHGELKLYEKTQSGRYFPSEPNFEGADQATFLVEIGGYQVKVIYFFKVMTDVPGSGAQGTPQDDPYYCPKGPLWRISFDANDPNAPIYTWKRIFSASISPFHQRERRNRSPDGVQRNPGAGFPRIASGLHARCGRQKK